MSNSTLKSLFAYKAWANHELFDVLASLSEAQHAHALRVAIRTLNHVHVVDRIFQSHLQAQAHGHAATNTNDTPTLDQLRSAVADTDGWYQRYVASLTSEQLGAALQFTFTDGDPGCMTREEILLHVVTHGGYHRGNVGQILKDLGVAPPRDLYTKFLHLSESGRRAQG
jgi:uncharacterized damage-inducible protein DinB